MNRHSRFVAFALSMIVPVIIGASCHAVSNDSPTTAPSPGGAAAPASNETLQSKMAEFDTAMGQFRALVSGIMVSDPAQRSAIAPKVIPVLKHLETLRQEIAATGDDGAQMSQQIGCQFQQLLLGFGDADMLAQTKLQSADKDPKVAAVADRNLIFADWMQNSTPSDQSKLLDIVQADANRTPKDIGLSHMLMLMSQIGASTPELHRRAKAIAAGMQTPGAADLKEEVAADEKIHSFVDKPIIVNGTTVDGKPFTTADWRGKVVLVDFWATWCGPCVAEMPRVRKAYADYHDKGLEIVGVSNDYDAKLLTAFTSADPKMPWPQLFDPKAAANQEWNSITESFGINGIPEMFLIDKQGVLRSVDVLDDLEQAVPKYLDQ